MSNDFDLDEFKNSIEDVLNNEHEHENDELDSTLVDLINIIRLNEVAAKAMSDKARKEQVVKVLDKLYSEHYSSNEDS